MFCTGCLFIVVLVRFLPARRRLGIQHAFKMVWDNQAAFRPDVLLLDGIYENSRLLVLLNPFHRYQAILAKEIAPREPALRERVCSFFTFTLYAIRYFYLDFSTLSRYFI